MITKFIEFINESDTNDIWYHGSYSDDITNFKTRRNTNKERLGSYFSNSKNQSAKYGSKIYTVKIHLKKTLDLTSFDDSDYEGFLNKLPIPEKEINYRIRQKILFNRPFFTPYIVLESLDRDFHIIPKLKKKGYDSIKFMENNTITTVVFYPEIIEIINSEDKKPHIYSN